VKLRLRPDAPVNLVKLAVGRCLIDTMDVSKWTELGLLTDSAERIDAHPRLLRSLRFGDDDYDGHVFDFVPVILGERTPPKPDPWGTPPPADEPEGLLVRYPNLEVVSDYIDLPAWVAENDTKLFTLVFAEESSDADATLPDGTVLSAAESAAARLEVGEMRRQVERIRRDHADDPEAAIGHAKELIETVCKTILGMTGKGGNAEMVKFPQLIKRTLVHLGIDPTQADERGTDPVQVRAAKQIIGGVSSLLHGADELRNGRGTGHGRSGAPLIDDAVARLTVGTVLPAVIYLIEVFEDATGDVDKPVLAARPTAPPVVATLEVGSVVAHDTFGDGQVEALSGVADTLVADVNFGTEIGTKRLLVRYAGLTVLK